MTLRLLVRGFNGPCASTLFVRASSAWTPPDFGLRLIAWIHATLHAVAVIPWNRHSSEGPLLLTTHLDQRGTGQAQFHRTLLWPRLSGLSRGPVRPSPVGRPSPGRSP